MTAGLIESKRRRATGRVVSIYKADEAGLDEAGGNYVTVCEEHGTICNHETLSMARRHAPYAEWCEDCQDPLLTDPNIAVQPEQNEEGWIEELRALGLVDDANFAELILREEVVLDDFTRAYALARENRIPTECVSKVMTFLRRKRRESIR